MAGFNHFPAIAARVKPFCQDVVRITAGQLQEDARAGAPVDTGFLQENIYLADWESSDYGAGSISPPGDSYLLPEETPSDDTTAIVGCAANYSIYLEMGTRFMPAQPFFYQAVDMAEIEFEAEMSKFEEAIGI